MKKPASYFGVTRKENNKIAYVSPPVISREIAIQLCKDENSFRKMCETHKNKIGNDVKRHQLKPRTRQKKPKNTRAKSSNVTG